MEADDCELELTDREIVDMVTEPAAPDAADNIDAETSHGDISRVTADDAFNALEVRLFSAHSNFISKF